MDLLNLYKQDLSSLSYQDIVSKNIVGNLQEACSYFDSMIENSVDGFFITDGSGTVLKINRSYEELSGLKRRELIGLNIREVVERKYVSNAVTLMAMKERRQITLDSVLLKTNKKVLVSCNPLFDERGNIALIVSNVRDLTELEFLKERLLSEEHRLNEYESVLETLKQQLYSGSNIIAHDISTIRLLQETEKTAKVDTTILLLGETGVGKEEFAKFIHEHSKRAKEHFIKVNCGALSKGLLESELFGYEKGAFTGASPKGKMGLFEIANKGTLFLDEIGEMPLDMQVSLLRVLQEREIQRVGGFTPIPIDVRVIAATNKDLKQMVVEGRFREDLFYRLNVVPIEIPPLRNRKEDIIPLAKKFLDEFNNKHGYDIMLSREAEIKLYNYPWPGNIRELRNVIERAVILNNSHIITTEDILANKSNGDAELILYQGTDLKRMLETYEYQFMKQAYLQCGNIRDAAKMLNMKKSTYAQKLKRYREMLD